MHRPTVSVGQPPLRKKLLNAYFNHVNSVSSIKFSAVELALVGYCYTSSASRERKESFIHPLCQDIQSSTLFHRSQ